MHHCGEEPGGGGGGKRVEEGWEDANLNSPFERVGRDINLTAVSSWGRVWVCGWAGGAGGGRVRTYFAILKGLGAKTQT